MKEFISECNLICNDKETGATNIIFAILNLFERMIDSDSSSKTAGFIQRAASRFIECHPTMAQVINLCRDIAECPKNMEKIRQCVSTWWQKILSQSKETAANAGKIGDIYNRIVTFSNSRLVFDAILEMKSKPEVLISESRPECEGLKMVRNLNEQGIEVTICVDAALPSFLNEYDVVMIGCDCITSEFVANKIGTFSLAMACERRDIPMYVLCPTSKYLSFERALFFHVVDHDPFILTQQVPEEVKIVNRYFDHTPIELIKHIIWESNVGSPSEFLSRG